MSALKILIYDIETAPSLGWIWSLWKEYIGFNQLEEVGRVLCWSAKWLDSEDVLYASEWEHGHEEMIAAIHELFNEADVIVAHNGNKFDKPTLHSAFIHYGMMPPSPTRSVDTFLVAKRNFNFISNRLGDLAKLLGVDHKKIKTDFELWTGVLHGDKKAQSDMIEYNIQDVLVLEDVYLKLRPWITNHPNVALEAEEMACTNCGSSNLQRRGKAKTATSVYQRYQCNDCGTWLRGRYTTLDRSNAKNILTQDKVR